MLLPKRRQEEANETEDPRSELERSLEEFKRMKEIRARIESLMGEEELYRTKKPEDIQSGEYTGRISLQKLSAAFYSLYDSLQEPEENVLIQEEVSLEDEMEELRQMLRTASEVDLMEYFGKKKTRLRLAVSLMAVLELIRTGEITVKDSISGLMLKGGEA